MRTSIAVAASLLSLASANPLAKRNTGGPCPAGYDTSDIAPSNAKCYRKSYQISVTPEISVFSNVESNANETYLTKLLFEFVTSLPAATNFTEKYLSGGEKKQISKTFDISGIYCTPNDGAKDDSAVQLLVHGIGFDSSYWNFGGEGINADYSYAYQAAKEGYNTFRYDRLGTGDSAHPADAYNVVQAPTDVAILVKIAAGLRDGSLTGKAFSKIAGVGHSYGSVQLNALLQKAPTALESVVLTGFSANTSAVPLYLTSTAYSTATNVFPKRFSTNDLTNAYLVTGLPQTNQLNFLYWSYYSDAAATRAREVEQPVSQGVLFTFGAAPGVASGYTGNVHVVTGAKDWIFCLGNCYAVPQGSSMGSILDGVAALFPNSAKFSTQVPANTGHGISAHYSAPQVYADIQTYLQSVGH